MKINDNKMSLYWLGRCSRRFSRRFDNFWRSRPQRLICSECSFYRKGRCVIQGIAGESVQQCSFTGFIPPSSREIIHILHYYQLWRRGKGKGRAVPHPKLVGYAIDEAIHAMRALHGEDMSNYRYIMYENGIALIQEQAWHTDGQLPDDTRQCLVVHDLGADICYCESNTSKPFWVAENKNIPTDRVTMWAYIDELIPKNKK